MTIQMQGSWTVSVKSKNAAYAQRFIVSGADVGNGTYDGKVSTPSVFVSGDTWSIRIQNKPPKKAWVGSDDQITFPTLAGSLVSFDIQSNDAGSDEDFNDLILTCSTPQTASDFILYGHASCYSGYCLLNPCFRGYVVIETPEAFQEAVLNPLLREAIYELYPERIKQYERPPLPIPEPDPPPFTPIMLPLREQTAVPRQLGQTVRLVSDMANADAPSRLTAGRVVILAEQPQISVAYDRGLLAGLVDKLRLRCNVEALPGFVLRFNEYDRTEAELSGGAYSGEGNRELLGLAVTDRNGNYIFRFSRTGVEFASEAVEDTPAGGDPLVQAMPDVIAQLLSSTAPDGVAHETGVYWNIPAPLKRIDICIPCSKVPTAVTECTGSHRFEAVGRIRVGIPENTFDDDGRITSTDDSENVPQANCATWGGTLDLFGCLGDHETVKHYTIHYRRYVDDEWTDWEFYQEPFKLFNTDLMDRVQIGPFDRDLEIVNGGPLVTAKAYNNVQGNSDWATSEWALRASVNTTKAPFAGHIGPVEFRIQGYDDDGQQVADPRTDWIRLYIDNQRPDFVLDTIALGEQLEGDNPCAVFTLDGEPVPAILTVRFKVIQEQGFLNKYDLSVRKGNYSDFDIKTTDPLGATSAALSNSYVHGGTDPCSDLVGTRPPDEMTAVGDFATAYIIPDGVGADWLESDETVCAYAVNLICSKRVTNGYNDAVDKYGPIQKLLAIKKE